ncbi:nucleotide exchange factor GrpE [Candidatus Clostridium radicumherbarum]|uniref:Protein GrpE n=1 Tax=Candidatus Clostridium radicumherbarum TaxID=3381662 RepID=A0ABW8TUT2_9CLOT
MEKEFKDENIQVDNEETLEQAELMEDKEFENTDNELLASLKGEFTKLQDDNRKLKEEKDKAENELNSIKDRLLRLSAEYENYRKRTAKEKEGIYSDACEDILKNMLPVLDNLERAAIVDGKAEDIKKGIDMTIRQFNDSLEKLQVTEIPVNEGFDPNMHNAVMHVDDDNFGQNEIAEVFQKGFIRGNKVIRHSIVKVAN